MVSKKDSIVEICCNDASEEDIVCYSLKALEKKFKLISDLIADCPDGNIDHLRLEISCHQLALVLTLTEDLTTPSLMEDWFSLFRAVDYLGLNEKYEKLLIKQGRKYLMTEKKVSALSDITYHDLIKKFQDLTYKTKRELEIEEEEKKKLEEQVLLNISTGRLGNITQIGLTGLIGAIGPSGHL